MSVVLECKSEEIYLMLHKVTLLNQLFAKVLNCVATTQVNPYERSNVRSDRPQYPPGRNTRYAPLKVDLAIEIRRCSSTLSLKIASTLLLEIGHGRETSR